MNLLISYGVKKDKSIEWVNPVRCYSLSSETGEIELDWLISEESRDQLLKKPKEKEDENKILFMRDNIKVNEKLRVAVGKVIPVGKGAFKYGVEYYSAFSFFGWRIPYTSIMQDDITKNKSFSHLKKWKDNGDDTEIVRLWEIVREKDL